MAQNNECFYLDSNSNSQGDCETRVKIEIPKGDKSFLPNLSIKGSNPPNRNFKEKTLNHHS